MERKNLHPQDSLSQGILAFLRPPFLVVSKLLVKEQETKKYCASLLSKLFCYNESLLFFRFSALCATSSRQFSRVFVNSATRSDWIKIIFIPNQ